MRLTTILVISALTISSAFAAGPDVVCRGEKTGSVVKFSRINASTLEYSRGSEKAMLEREPRTGSFLGWSEYDNFIAVAFQANRSGRIVAARISSEGVETTAPRRTENFSCEQR